MTRTTIDCPKCYWPNLTHASLRTYDVYQCGNCGHHINLVVDALERIGQWRRTMAKTILADQWESYLDGSRGVFAEHIARALRQADEVNAAKIREGWPLIYTAWECRGDE